VRPIRAIVPAACALGLLVAAPALADQQIVAAPIDRYVTTAVTIAPGEALAFASRDPLAEHDVVARDTDLDGAPLFGSATIRNGQKTPVTGVEDLVPGSYAFYCTIHPKVMNGTLTVSDGSVESFPVPPVLQARIETSGLRSLERRRALLAMLTSDRGVSGSLTARTLGTTLAHRSVALRPGATTVSLKLTGAGLRAIRRRPTVNIRLTLSARDAAGTTGAAAAQRTLRRSRSGR
jgi:plastocyanin